VAWISLVASLALPLQKVDSLATSSPFQERKPMRSIAALKHVSLLAATGVLAACSGGLDFDVVQSGLARDTSPNVPPQDATQLAKDNAQLAADLYSGVATDETSNVFYSPYSVSVALAMTYAGAGGTTASQMAQALHFSLPASQLHAAFDAVDLALASRAHGQPGTKGAGFKLDVVDSIWGDRTLPVQQPFLDTLALDYGAGLRVVDFLHSPDPARQTINAWVENETNQKIVDLLPQSSVTSDTRMVLVNAIYFNAAWSTPFDTNSTHAEVFNRLDGATSTSSAIENEGNYAYAQGSGWQAVELPYSGDQTSMVVVLPDAGKFASVEAGLSGDFVTGVFAGLQGQNVDVTLPKFSIHGGTISLKSQLQKLGMVDAFDAAAADFSAMSSEHLWVGDVLHQAFVNVDESGTEAAAATAVTMLGGAANPDTVVHFDANRPFLFFIRDIPTNTVLFVGRVLDPAQSP
jgi:serpin B